jgi:hypothetical protein
MWLTRRWWQLGPTLRIWLLLFSVAIALDAWWTGPWSPVAPDHPWSQPVAIAFVVLGDWRYFALGEREVTQSARGWLTGLGWTLVVPVLHGLAIRAWPEGFTSMHVVFLTYELAQALVVSLWWHLRGRRLSSRHQHGAVHRWLRWVTAFELLQYLSWACADGLILQGSDAGYGLRLLPNLLYYAGFLAFTAWLAPRPAATPKAESSASA